MKTLGVEVPIVCDEQRLRPAGREVERLLADNARARTVLDWEPGVTLENGIRKTAEWLRGRFSSGQTITYNR